MDRSQQEVAAGKALMPTCPSSQVRGFFLLVSAPFPSIPALGEQNVLTLKGKFQVI